MRRRSSRPASFVHFSTKNTLLQGLFMVLLTFPYLISFYCREERNVNPFRRFFLYWTEKFIEGRLINYPYLHKIDKIYVNIRTREVTLDFNRKQQKALTVRSPWIFSKQQFFMDKSAFTYIIRKEKLSLESVLPKIVMN